MVELTGEAKQKLAALREKELLNNVRTLYTRYTSYIISETRWLYEEFVGEPPSDELTKHQLVTAIIDAKWGEESRRRAFEKLRFPND